MNVLDEKAATRLASVCELTASSFEGEALAAARQANAMIRAVGVTWTAIIEAAFAPREPALPEPRRTWLDMIARGLAQPEMLYPAEPKFLNTLRAKIEAGARPSAKQLAWLQKIVARVTA